MGANESVINFKIDFCDACKTANAQPQYCGYTHCNPDKVVIVTVKGGVADVEKAPPGIKVQIVDYNEN